jgi:hypothetical protein
MKNLIILLLIISIGAAFSSAPATGDPQLLKVTLKPIVDKATTQPISTNAITCTWYSGQGEVIKTEKYQDRGSLELSVVGDVESWLAVLFVWVWSRSAIIRIAERPSAGFLEYEVYHPRRL